MYQVKLKFPRKITCFNAVTQNECIKFHLEHNNPVNEVI